ncbi:hypothetical protein O7A70_10415 [Mesorhizobium sp. Cs1299R1N1]|uniref:hypothetical protein n=1 Tax=Mesorhizobium sp. Cs1299R1N1 TaxID=3015172 RepID=UPI00301DF71F
MATYTKLSSGSWRVQVRRKGRYASETFLRRDDARRWATETERQVDHGETPTKSRKASLKTFGELIDLHIDDMREVGKSPRRSKASVVNAPYLRCGGADRETAGPRSIPCDLLRQRPAVAMNQGGMSWYPLAAGIRSR